MLKFIYTNKDEIPDGLAEHYTESNGKWVLNCEGAVPNARLDEFRQTNIDLKKKLEAFGDIDPVKAKELMAKADEIEAAKVKGDDAVKELVEKRVAKMKEEHDREMGVMRTKLETTESQLAARTIDAALIEAGAEFGLRQTAHDDAVARGRTVFKLEDGKPVAYKGEEKLYGKDGSPMTPREFIEGLTKAAPHLFEPSEGSGAGGSGAGGGGGRMPEGGNPWMKETFNLTRQAQVMKADPAAAKRLAAKAGVPLKI
jgi:hypothetical protein